MTLNEHIALLPASSTHVYVINVEPTSNLSPGALVPVQVGVMPELSVAVGSVQVTVRESPSVACTVMSSGQLVIVGGSVSPAVIQCYI